MKPIQFTFTTVASLFVCAALWSCNEDRTSSELTEMRPAQEQQALADLPSSMPRNGNAMMDPRGNGNAMMDPGAASCPMVVPGADVAVVDTESGVALAFTTDTGDVAELRTRVRSMAQTYQMHRRQAGLRWRHVADAGMGYGGRGMGGKGMGYSGRGTGRQGMGRMVGRSPMPATSATATDIDNGAQLEFRPTDPSQLDALREQVRWHQQRMHSGECWIAPTQTPQGEQE